MRPGQRLEEPSDWFQIRLYDPIGAYDESLVGRPAARRCDMRDLRDQALPKLRLHGP